MKSLTDRTDTHMLQLIGTLVVLTEWHIVRREDPVCGFGEVGGDDVADLVTDDVLYKVVHVEVVLYKSAVPQSDHSKPHPIIAKRVLDFWRLVSPSEFVELTLPDFSKAQNNEGDHLCLGVSSTPCQPQSY